MNNSIAITSNTIVFSSMKLFFLVSKSFMNFAYVDIWSKVSVKWILICNLLRISRNMINYLYSSLMEHVDKVNPEFLLFSLTLNFYFLIIFLLTSNQIVTNPPPTTVPLLIVITLQCSLKLVYVLAENWQLCRSANFLAIYPSCVSKFFITTSLFIWLAWEACMNFSKVSSNLLSLS